MSPTAKKGTAPTSKKEPLPSHTTDPSVAPTVEDASVTTEEDRAENPDAPKVETEVVDTEFYYVQELDPARQISPTGVYLDFEQRVAAEKLRAKVEGREPDLENPPASQSTPLQSAKTINHAMSTLSTAEVEPAVTLPVVVVKDAAVQEENRDDKNRVKESA